MQTKNYCNRCGKKLVRLHCYTCNGRGYARGRILRKRVCQACSGRGIRLRCPDEVKHILSDFDVKGKAKGKSVQRGFQRKDQYISPKYRRIVSTERQVVPPPWHPSYPNPWHPNHPRNPANKPWNPANPHKKPFGF